MTYPKAGYREGPWEALLELAPQTSLEHSGIWESRLLMEGKEESLSGKGLINHWKPNAQHLPSPQD